MITAFFIIGIIALFYQIVLNGFKIHLNHQSQFASKIKNEYKGFRIKFNYKEMVTLSDYPEIVKIYNQSKDIAIIAFMSECFCFHLKFLIFLQSAFVYKQILSIIISIINKEILIMDIVLMLIIIIVFVYFNYYFRCEKSADDNDARFCNYLTEKKDETTLNIIKRKIFNVDKAIALINRYYETKDSNYLVFAIQRYIIHSYLIVLILGTILAFLMFVLVFGK